MVEDPDDEHTDPKTMPPRIRIDPKTHTRMGVGTLLTPSNDCHEETYQWEEQWTEYRTVVTWNFIFKSGYIQSRWVRETYQASYNTCDPSNIYNRRVISRLSSNWEDTGRNVLGWWYDDLTPDREGNIHSTIEFSVGVALELDKHKRSTWGRGKKGKVDIDEPISTTSENEELALRRSIDQAAEKMQIEKSIRDFSDSGSDDSVSFPSIPETFDFQGLAAQHPEGNVIKMTNHKVTIFESNIPISGSVLAKHGIQYVRNSKGKEVRLDPNKNYIVRGFDPRSPAASVEAGNLTRVRVTLSYATIFLQEYGYRVGQ